MIGSLRAKALTAVLAVAAIVLGLAAAAPVATATADTPSGVTVASPAVTVGDTLSVAFSAPADHVSATNWIQLQLGGSTSAAKCYSPSTQWAYTSSGTTSAGSTAVASGTIDFHTTGWATGSYVAYLCYNDGYSLIGTPAAVTVAPVQPVTVTTSGSGTVGSAPANPAQGDRVTLSQTPAAGYAFAGWQLVSPTDGSVAIAADGTFTMPGARVVVNARFAPVHYTVHFDGNGADAGTMADEAFTYDQSAALTANAFTRAGYVFAGWAPGPAGTPAYSDGAEVSDLTSDDQATVTLYAVWHAATPTVSIPAPDVLDVDFASGAPVDHAQGLTATSVGTPTVAEDDTLGQSVATFDGATGAYQYDFSSQYPKMTQAFSIECEFRWNGPALSTLKASAFPAICSGEQNGGANIEVYNNKLNASMLIGSSYYYAYAAADAVTPGRWYDAVSTFDGTNLDFYLDGERVASTPAAGSMALPPAASRKWTLGGDVSSTGGVEQLSPVSLANSRIWSGSLTAAQVAAEYAASQKNPVTVTLSGKGTATADPASAGAGVTVGLRQSPDIGYHFGGWNVVEPADGSVGIGSDDTFTMPAAPVTIAADFVPNGYTVHFDGNGADSGTMADEPLSYDRAAALPGVAFTKAGDDFAGWAPAADAFPAYADGATVSNLTSDDQATVTLYATWVPQGQSLVEVSSGGHGTASAGDRSAAPGTTVTLTATPDTGYRFAGWQVTVPADGSVTVAGDGTFTMPDGTVAVTASFVPDSYTVVFDGNGADAGAMAPIAFSYDQVQTLPAASFDRDGRAFAGWSTSADGAVAYPDGAEVSNLASTDGATVTLYAQWRPVQPAPGSWPSLQAGFITDTFKLPAAVAGGTVQQQLTGLWNGAAPTSFTKASGDAWLSVDASGLVTGTAPARAPRDGGAITVSATDGTTTSQILVEVPVGAAGAAPELRTASWNAWEGGSHVTDALGKDLAVIAARGIGAVGFQDGGAQQAQQVAAALGWNARRSGDVGIVSAFPFAADPVVSPTDTAPALAATVDVHGSPVRLWDVSLDEAASDTAARAAQAQAVADAMGGDIASATTPVVLLGDLGSPDLAPVFAAVGLRDSYREANPDATTAPGTTWPVYAASAATAARIDYVDYTATGGLTPLSSSTVTVGWPSATDVAGNSWAGDHAAVETLFSLGAPDTTPAPESPTATVVDDTIAYQVNAGPADADAFLSDIGAASDDNGATLSADLGQVRFAAPGWYTAMVTASDDGLVSDPVAIAVRVAPVPGLALGGTTASFTAGDVIDEATVLARLEPALDVPGATRVDLSRVDAATAGSYPVKVTPHDDWGFTGPQQDATVVVAPGPSFTVAFDANGGTGAMTSLTVPLSSTTVTLPRNGYTRVGYAFAGWAASAAGGAAYADGQTAGDLTAPDGATVTLYAVWTPIAYTIDYELAGGTAFVPNPSSYTIESPGFTLAVPTRDGYTFSGWTGTGLTGASPAVTIATGSTGDRSYTANWTAVVTPPPVRKPLKAATAVRIPTKITVGQRVTATPAVWQGGVTPSRTTYQWLLDGTAIAGATGSSYQVPAAAAGHGLTVTETAAATGYTVGTSTAKTVKVAAGTFTTARPTITGTVRVAGQVAVAASGWTPKPTRLSYQWYANGTALAGATAARYTIPASAAGTTLTVKVTGAANGYTTASATSAGTRVADGSFVHSASRARITGIAKVGSTVTATRGTWAPTPSRFAYQWYANGTAVRGATKSTLKLPASVAKQKLTVRITASRAGYAAVTISSPAVTVAPGTLTAATPKLTGAAKPGATLTVAAGRWEPSGVKLSYQWLRDGRAIPHATTTRYTLTAADAGHRVSVRVTGSKAGYATLFASSTPKTVPAAAPPGHGGGGSHDGAGTPGHGSGSPVGSGPGAPGRPGGHPAGAAPAASESDATPGTRGSVRVTGPATAGAAATVIVGTRWAGQTVYPYLFSTPIALAVSTVASDGTIRITIPSTVSGRHRVAVYAAGGSLIGWDDITITPAAVGAGAVPSVGGSLAHTGTSVSLGWLAAAVLLIIAGAGILLARRRRRA